MKKKTQGPKQRPEQDPKKRARQKTAQKLSDASGIIIRPAKKSDAAAFLDLRLQTERETEMMGYLRGERKPSMVRFRKMLRELTQSTNETLIFAELDGKLIGFVMAYGSNMRVFVKTRTISIAIVKKHWGKGIGNMLMEAIIDWGKKAKLHRLDLTVWNHNENAIKLYKKFGFQDEGIKKEAIIIGKKYVDVRLMALILE